MKAGGIKFGAPLLVDADGQIKTGQGKLWGFLVIGGAGAASIDFHDALSTSGDPIMSGSAPINTCSPVITFFDVDGIPFNTGLYANIGGTGAVVYVWFR